MDTRSISKIGPVTKWPGGKWRIVDWLIENLPKHDCFLESHFGTGALFFNKEPSNVEIINDRDSLIMNLFRVIRNSPSQLEAAIALTPWARQEYLECSGNLCEGDEVERARRLLVAMWQGVGVRRASNDDENKGSNCGWRVRNTLHQSPVPTWQRLPERVRQASLRLLNAQIENRPANDVILQHASKEVLIYADPPYVQSARGSDPNKSTRLYAHEMSDDDHVELLKVLKSHPGPVLLSGYSCALYDEHLDWMQLSKKARIQTNAERQEILYINPRASRLLDQSRLQQTLF